MCELDTMVSHDTNSMQETTEPIQDPNQIIILLCQALDQCGAAAFEGLFRNETDADHELSYNAIMRIANAALNQVDADGRVAADAGAGEGGGA